MSDMWRLNQENFNFQAKSSDHWEWDLSLARLSRVGVALGTVLLSPVLLTLGATTDRTSDERVTVYTVSDNGCLGEWLGSVPVLYVNEVHTGTAALAFWQPRSVEQTRADLTMSRVSLSPATPRHTSPPCHLRCRAAPGKFTLEWRCVELPGPVMEPGSPALERLEQALRQ